MENSVIQTIHIIGNHEDPRQLIEPTSSSHFNNENFKYNSTSSANNNTENYQHKKEHEVLGVRCRSIDNNGVIPLSRQKRGIDHEDHRDAPKMPNGQLHDN
ncbi:hypothetical protein PV328_001054 [Microctonus aethiopoides]|uniref:Uncharacterized protein n=1 Tax=Microctonus aethiopoides TaxID=144406 RepID=A0AA39FWR5_9HYME|nr:hypothetical protein PV328_001054 [Microctonus aethiopoides]